MDNDVMKMIEQVAREADEHLAWWETQHYIEQASVLVGLSVSSALGMAARRLPSPSSKEAMGDWASRHGDHLAAQVADVVKFLLRRELPYVGEERRVRLPCDEEEEVLEDTTPPRPRDGHLLNREQTPGHRDKTCGGDESPHLV